jgi:hypothetical protein
LALMSEPTSIVVSVDLAPDADPEETDRLTAQLRSELLQLDVDRVDSVSAGPAPEGAKAVELVALGALVVKFGPQLITAVAGVLQAWTARSERRKLTVQIGDSQITLAEASDEERRRLIEAFLAAHVLPGGVKPA